MKQSQENLYLCIMMNPRNFYQKLLEQFPFETTVKQNELLFKLSNFVLSENNDKIFVLKGFAGTGKTSVLSTLINGLYLIKKKYVMLAPTGRAAKVVSNYSGKPAFTIHKHIYYTKDIARGGFTLKANKHKNTIFVVDEASMLSDNATEGSTYGSLLDDLIYFVYSGVNCRLILVGDTAQLPPVNQDKSIALDENQLSLRYQLSADSIELDEVMRQAEHSGILYNATLLREMVQSPFPDAFSFDIQHYTDIVRLQDSYDTLDAIHDAYGRDGAEDTMFIVRSNKRANLYNQHIRQRILDREGELNAGDYLMVVKNNYYWLKDKKMFIANGDILEVMRIYNFMELYGFRFAEVQARLIDYPDIAPFDTIILLDTLTSESPSLTYEEYQRFYQQVALDYEEVISKRKKQEKIHENEYFNALQVKFGYAVTCHKSQGGQWKKIFVEQPYLPEGFQAEDIKWLYTAITRATEKLYLLGFEDRFFLTE